MTSENGSNLKIRGYLKKDFEVYVDLLVLTSRMEYSTLGREDIAEALESLDKNGIWVADICGRQVGFTSVRVEKLICHLIWLDVHPDHQRMGIGTKLLEVVEDKARSLNLGQVVCEVWDGNEKGTKFYLKNGFLKKRWMEKYFSNGLDAWLMVKRL